MQTTTPFCAACAPDNAEQARCLLALTRLAPDVRAAEVADIFKRARDRHRDLAITGAMLFDGERFGYLLCGASAQVRAAFDAVTVDPRQALPEVLADDISVPAWAGSNWTSGWSEPDALAVLAPEEASRHDAVMQTWQALIKASDLL